LLSCPIIVSSTVLCYVEMEQRDDEVSRRGARVVVN
jgi:hypothetical protein